MRRCLCWTMMAAGLAAAARGDETPPNTLSAEESANGWRLLFDGETTKGWRNYKSKDVNPGWQVEGGTLVRKKAGAGDIVTVEQFDCFELTLDYKIAVAGNSGLMYHVLETQATPWMTGPEVQIQDNVAGHDPQKSGWLYQLHKSKIDATKPAGEWNTLRILITPVKCEHWMNGKKYCEYVKGSEDWNERVAKSKFAKYEGFGKAKKGHLCLQDHGDEVAFRNIKVRGVKPVFD